MKRIKVYLTFTCLATVGLLFGFQQSAHAHYFDVWSVEIPVIGDNGEITAYQCIYCDEFGKCITLTCKRLRIP